MALQNTGTVGHSEIMAEFGKTGAFDLSAHGAPLIGKTANTGINETDFYGATASDAINGPWNYYAGDYKIDMASQFYGTKRSVVGLDYTGAPRWNTTGAAFDKTAATKMGTNAHDSIPYYQERGSQSGYDCKAYNNGLYLAIDSQYPNDGSNWTRVWTLYPFQKMKPRTMTFQFNNSSVRVSGNDAGRSALLHVWVRQFDTWNYGDAHSGYCTGEGPKQFLFTIGGQGNFSRAITTTKEFLFFEYKWENNCYNPITCDIGQIKVI